MWEHWKSLLETGKWDHRMEPVPGRVLPMSGKGGSGAVALRSKGFCLAPGSLFSHHLIKHKQVTFTVEGSD